MNESSEVFYGELETLVRFNNGAKRAPKGKTKKITNKNLETMFCNSCKVTTPNAQDTVYNFNTNTTKTSASNVCSICLSKKIVYSTTN